MMVCFLWKLSFVAESLSIDILETRVFFTVGRVDVVEGDAYLFVACEILASAVIPLPSRDNVRYQILVL